MEYKEFEKEIIENGKKIGLDIAEKEVQNLYKYMLLMLEWNKNVNLTAITEEKEIIYKHFIDSLSVNKYLTNKEKIMDIGTGAGFPGIPLKIFNEDLNFILVDSLNKRINFLEEVKNELNLNKLELVHARAEELAKNKNYRENMDIVVSRAVARLRILAEYMLPFVKKNGICICMKGPNIEEEIEESKKSLEILGGKIEKIEHIILPGDLERNIILIRKIKETPSRYPRKAGTPVKQPL
jgi:16S rRNA (guanine527-N7)-methyltransferase